MKNNYLDNLLEQYGSHVFARWNAPQGALYIGRGSIYGNPFPMASEADRVRVCLEFRDYCINRLRSDTTFRNAVRQLHGKNVMCFCSNGTTSTLHGARYCHGHILLAASNYLHTTPSEN